MAKRAFIPRRPGSPRASAADPIPHINDLIRTAKAGWLGLLAYLAYVGVTLMGVIDADFFMPEKQTQLPLIGVSIPTTLFFAISPLLGAMLFAYLHLYLLKLWEALTEAPAQIGGIPLGDQITPWLIADFALSHRADAALRPRPMRRLANVVSALLVFAAAPAVLAGFWWRSMPKHDEALTVIACGIPLTAAIYTTLNSWARLRRLARGKPALPLWGRRTTWGLRVGSLALALMGWMTTEGTLDHYARVTGFYDYQHLKLWRELEKLGEDALKDRFAGITDFTKYHGLKYLADRELETRWWTQTWLPELLVKAQLAGTVFVETPPDWLPYDQARRAFWLQECKAEGLTPSLCGHQTDADVEAATKMHNLRAAWCAKALGLQGVEAAKSCEQYFTALSARIAGDWKIARQNALNALPDRNLSEADLRFADLSAANTVGANLSRVRMEGACLNRAQMEGANLSHVHIRRASLRGARLELADLSGAHMEGALLGGAKFDSADLSGARLESAFFSDSNLSDAQNLEIEQLDTSFGDGGVILPGGFGPDSEIWPENWSDTGLTIYNTSMTNMLNDHIHLGPVSLDKPRFCQD